MPFEKAFPREFAGRVKVIALMMQADGARNAPSDSDVCFLVGGNAMRFPYRIWQKDLPGAAFLLMSETDKVIAHCLGTRHHDGFVRQKHVRALLRLEYPDWAIPYIVKLCEEYVIEILEDIYGLIDEKDVPRYKAFAAENAGAMKKGFDRMISYWNEYYRIDHFRLREYVGYRVYREKLVYWS